METRSKCGSVYLDVVLKQALLCVCVVGVLQAAGHWNSPGSFKNTDCCPCPDQVWDTHTWPGQVVESRQLH